ncbi:MULTISPECIES: DUF4099 domain-containing protein [Alistipes]
MGIEKLDRALDSIIQVREGKDQDGSLAKEVSDYELNNEGRIAKFADRYKFEERELPWDQIQALGLNKEILLENQSMGDILKGRIPNKLVPLKHKVDGRWVDLGLGTISPIRDDAGNVQLRIFTRLDEPQYKISPYKELFTDKEIERLETDGHLGSTKKMKDFTSGRECECYVSVHEATNRLTTLPVDALTLPTRIYGKEIGDDIEALRSGKEIFVEDIHLKDGRVISGHARVDANRGDVVFRNDNNPHLRIHDTVFGVKVSTDIQAKLANHEVVFIPGMKVGGKTISTDLRYSDTGRPLFGNNARNYRSRLGEENPRPRQRVRRRLPSLPGAQPKGMKIG